jgi:hypothetical protein
MAKLLFGYNQLFCAESVLNGEWSLSLFEDLNRLIEGVVLYDEIVLLGAHDASRSNIYSTLKHEGVITEWLDDDLLRVVARPETQERFRSNVVYAFGISNAAANQLPPSTILTHRIPATPADQEAYTTLARSVGGFQTAEGYDLSGLREWLRVHIVQSHEHAASFNYFTRSLLYSAIADTADLDYAPDFLRLPIAAAAFSAPHKPVTKALYDALRSRLESEVEALTALGMPAAMFLPPLTSAVLQRGTARGDILAEVLELRRRFEPYRATYREFEAILRDKDRTLGDKIAAKKRLFTEIVGVLDSKPGEHALHIRTLWDKVVSSSLDEKGVGTTFSLSGAVSLLVDQLLVERTKGRARALFDLWTDALNVKDYGSLVRRTFGVEISPAEVDFVKEYSQAVRAIIRSGAFQRPSVGSG